MSRLFDGVDDVMEYLLDTTGVGTYTYGTFLMVLKVVKADDSGWMSGIEMEASDGDINGAMGRHTTAGQVYFGNQFTSHIFTLSLTDADGWVIVAVAKADGTAAPVLYKKRLGLPIEIEVATATLSNHQAPIDGTLKIGGDEDPANILVAATGVLTGVVLDEDDIESIDEARATMAVQILGNAASWLVDDHDGLATDLFGNHDRSAIVGTTHSTDEPPNWQYGLLDDEAPANSALPELSGTVEVSRTLTASNGGWTGWPPPAYTYQWQRDTGSGFGNIGAATSRTYDLIDADERADIRCVVTATNSQGAASANSNTVGPVAPASAAFIVWDNVRVAMRPRIATESGRYP